MATQVQNRRGTTAEHSIFTGANGELTVDTTKRTLVVHDGATAGGRPLLREDQSNLPTSAPTTGIYNASGSLAISTGGSGRLFVDASGNVGVGASPVVAFAGQTHLTVNHSSGGTTVAGINLATDGTRRASLITYPSNSEALRITAESTTLPITVHTNGSERLRITSAGLVGVGTSSPQGKLHVKDGYLGVEYNSGGLYPAYATYFGAFGTNFSSGGSEFDIWNTVGGGFAFRKQTAASTQSCLMYISSAGNVGVGTTSPGAALNIGADGDFWLASSVNNVEEKNLISWRIEDGSEGARISAFREAVSNAPHSILFSTRTTGGALTEKARIDSSGRLLVGTSSARETNTGNDPFVQFERSSGSALVLSATKNGADAFGPYFTLIKSRGTSAGANNLVSSGDELGSILFYGTDGTNPEAGAAIQAYVDGTPGANDMPGRLVFSTTADGESSPTERMRIGQTGYTKISNTGSYLGAAATYHEIVGNAGSGSLALSIANTNATGNGVQINSNSDGLSYVYLLGYSTSASANRIIIWSNGNVVNTNNSYGAISDIKLKENIVDANSQWDDLKALQVRNYNFKEGQTHTQIGLVAQEVELVSPGLVTESPDRDAKGNDLGTTTKSVNYSVLYMKAVKALQEAMERIETLESEMAAVKAQLA